MRTAIKFIIFFTSLTAIELLIAYVLKISCGEDLKNIAANYMTVSIGALLGALWIKNVRF